MGINIRNEIKAKIDDQYSYIAGLMNSYPMLSENWKNEQCNKFRNIAKESSDGDNEIEIDIYKQLVSGLENSDLEESIFNNSMFLMVFSYFEGIINTIAIKEGIVVLTKKNKQKKMPSADEIISQIEKAKKITLSAESKQIQKDIQILRKLRNDITHNNGALCDSLTQEISNIDIYNGTIVIHNFDFVYRTLDKIHSLLKELSILLDYEKYVILEK